jgi:hypothetical protein
VCCSLHAITWIGPKFQTLARQAFIVVTAAAGVDAKATEAAEDGDEEVTARADREEADCNRREQEEASTTLCLQATVS